MVVVERTAQVETPWLFTRLQCPVRQGAVKVGIGNADDGIIQRSMQSPEADRWTLFVKCKGRALGQAIKHSRLCETNRTPDEVAIST
jgi:hypothetical protein